jgi:hypothetical protein
MADGRGFREVVTFVEADREKPGGADSEPLGQGFHEVVTFVAWESL